MNRVILNLNRVCKVCPSSLAHSKKSVGLLAKNFFTVQKFKNVSIDSTKNKNFLLSSQYPARLFSQNKVEEETIVEMEEEVPLVSHSEHKEFKAETKRLLDIVAKSIYTDKEVFLRELVSNASDALEKQRYRELVGQAKETDEPLYISIITNDKERTVTIFDSGIGMTREDMINNLGTIAKSGSQEFIDAIKDQETPAAESIIGQFGVGFYSTFIVADMVEVISKSEDSDQASRWVSDGSGSYEISDVDNINFKRGTKILLRLKPESREFSREKDTRTILEKYSLFITHPIKLNGEQINNLQAIWYRDKKEVTDDQYETFYEKQANTKVPYKFKLHYSADVPLAIKAIIYIPSTHTEKMGIPQEEINVHLYSRKILIKANCRDLVPHYLRFVRGVVDCEDLPLNISRENYQDSSLISKLK